MISSINAAFPKRLQDLNMDLPDPSARISTTDIEKANRTAAASSSTASTAISSTPAAQSFGDVLTQAVNGVNDKMQTAEVEKAKVMSGETNNLHQAMLSIQEAGVAFSLMNEVRNKLVESYQEIMRMQV